MSYGPAEARKDLLDTYRNSELQFLAFTLTLAGVLIAFFFTNHLARGLLPWIGLILASTLTTIYRAEWWAQLTRVALSLDIPKESLPNAESANALPWLHNHFEMNMFLDEKGNLKVWMLRIYCAKNGASLMTLGAGLFLGTLIGRSQVLGLVIGLLLLGGGAYLYHEDGRRRKNKVLAYVSEHPAYFR